MITVQYQVSIALALLLEYARAHYSTHIFSSLGCAQRLHLRHAGRSCTLAHHACAEWARLPPSIACHLSCAVPACMPNACVCACLCAFICICERAQVQKESLYDAFYRLTDSRQQISSYVFDEVRAAVPKMNLDDVFSEKETIAKRCVGADRCGGRQAQRGYAHAHVCTYVWHAFKRHVVSWAATALLPACQALPAPATTQGLSITAQPP